MSAAIFAKLQTGEVAEALRWRRRVIDCWPTTPKGNISGLGITAGICSSTAQHRPRFSVSGRWRDDLRQRASRCSAICAAVRACVIVITYSLHRRCPERVAAAGSAACPKPPMSIGNRRAIR